MDLKTATSKGIGSSRTPGLQTGASSYGAGCWSVIDFVFVAKTVARAIGHTRMVLIKPERAELAPFFDWYYVCIATSIESTIVNNLRLNVTFFTRTQHVSIHWNDSR